MPELTLHHGDAQASFTEHPMEVARRALKAAAELEPDGRMARTLTNIADDLPFRDRLARGPVVAT